MLQYLALIVWIGFSVAVGVAARRLQRSAAGWLLVALVMSPPFAFILLHIFPPAMVGLTLATVENPGTATTAGAMSVNKYRAGQRAASVMSAVVPRVLAGLGVLALGILAPAVWYSSSIHNTVMAQTFSALSGDSPMLTGDAAWLWCPDCAAKAEPVHLWQKAGRDRGAMVTSAPNGTAVILSKLTAGDDGRTWYRVMANGQSGYVSSSLITFTDPTELAAPAPVVSVAAVPAPTAVPAIEEARVAATANLRAGPGTEYAVTGGLSAGDTVKIMGQNDAGDWYRLSSGEWIAAFLVTKVTSSRQSDTGLLAVAKPAVPHPPKVKVQKANLRNGPGTDFSVVGSLSVGQALEVVGVNTTGDWYQLVDGRWIFAALVSDPPPDLVVVTEPAPARTG